MVPVSRIGKTEKDLIVKNGDKFINNEYYLSIFYSTIVSNNVEKDFYNAFNNVAFKKWLLAVFPEVEEAQNQSQNTPWHLYNVLDHILFTVKYVNMQTGNKNLRARQILALSAFLHDLGKPFCATKKEVNGTVYDTFKGHAQKGVEIAKRALKHFKVNSEEQKIIEFLIENHDFLMELNANNIKTVNVSAVKNVVFKTLCNLEKIEENKILLYLFILALADNMAQNLDLTTKNIALLSKLKKEIKI
ncbi:MAG: HD domain-containing protein [Clostridia bacterium]|nr:HD domain-containing protein [Clostridia bacterium]